MFLYQYKISQILIFAFMAITINAGTVSIALDKHKTPAKDLIFNGELIDSENLVGKEDLSKYDPQDDHFWADTPYEPNRSYQFPSSSKIVKFISYKPSTKGLFRFSVDNEFGEAFTMTASLDNHGILLRAELMRKLGYKIHLSKYYKKFRLEFDSIDAKKEFLNSLADYTFTSRDRWIVENEEGSKQVLLQGLIAAPGNLPTLTYHQALFIEGAVEQAFYDKRAYRALIIAFVIGNLGEKINQFSSAPNAVFNESIIYDHQASVAFSNTSKADAKWLVKRMAKLSKSDWYEIAANAALPETINELVYRKLLASRDDFIKAYFGRKGFRKLKTKAFKPKLEFDQEHINKGKLLTKKFDGYAYEFTSDSKKSPLRASEMGRLFALESISVGLSEAFSNLSQQLQLSDLADVTANHADDLKQDFIKHIQQNGPYAPYQVPSGFWGGPLVGLNVYSNRQVVTGTYYGSDATVQLVDSAGTRASLGAFIGYDGIENVIPAAVVNGSIQKDYIHVRPIGSMKDALKKNWKDLAVNRFMKKLGKSLDPKFTCSLGQKLFWIDDNEQSDIVNLFFDSSKDGARQEAIKFGLENFGAGNFLLLAVDKSKKCIDEEVETRHQSFITTLEKLAPGEIIIVSEGLGLGANASFSVPLASLFAVDASIGSTISIGGGYSYTSLKRTLITKTQNGLQVYLQYPKIRKKNVNVSLNYYINILRATRVKKYGTGHTEFYDFNTEEMEAEDEKKLIQSLIPLFKKNDSSLIEKNYESFSLDHETRSRLLDLKLLFFRKNSVKEGHQVKVLPPMEDKVEREKYERTLYMYTRTKRKGRDYFTFLTDILKYYTDGVGPDTSRFGNNPATSILGHGSWQSTTTEAEITPESNYVPITVHEDVWAGWTISKKGLMGLFDKVENKLKELGLERGLIRRGIFNTVEALELYELRASTILYPEAMNKIKTDIESNGPIAFFKKILPLKKFSRQCQNADEEFKFKVRRRVRCLPIWARGFVKEMRRPKDDLKKRVKSSNKHFTDLMRKGNRGLLFKYLGKNNYFHAIRVSGFAKNKENPELSFLSDTIGLYDTKKGAGIFKEFSSDYGISASEIYATYLGEGF